MRRFHQDNFNQHLVNGTKSLPYYESFKQLIEPNVISHSQEGTSGDVILASKFVLSILSSDDLIILRSLYAKLYPEYSADICNGIIKLSSTYRKYASLTKNNKHINSMFKRSATNTYYVLACPVFSFTSSDPSEFEGNQRPVKLHYFMEHSLLLPGIEKPQTHVLACASWPMVHPDRFAMGKPVEVWCHELYEPNSANSFIPASRISKRVIYSTENLNHENVLVIIPIIE